MCCSCGARLAAPQMIARARGLIVNVSSSGSVKFSGNVAYGVGKAGVDKLTSDLAEALRSAGVAVVSIWPPLTRTEAVEGQPDLFPDLSRASPPIFTGRVVAALAANPEIIAKSGQALRITALAEEYGIEAPVPA
jgi:dehydrogenase/reductase SDR family member 1